MKAKVFLGAWVLGANIYYIHTHTHICIHTYTHTLLQTPNMKRIFNGSDFSVFTLLLLLSHFSRVQLCVNPQTAAHQAPPSLGFSRQEHWSGLPFPSPGHACVLSCFGSVWLCGTPMDSSPAGSFVLWVLQARTLEWVSVPSPVHACMHAKLLQSCLTLWDPHGQQPSRLLCPRGSPGKNTGVGCRSFSSIYPSAE